MAMNARPWESKILYPKCIKGASLSVFPDIAKRLKRHIKGQVHVFRVHVIPGFEQVFMQELQSKIASSSGREKSAIVPVIEAPGVVRFGCYLETAWAVAAFSLIATRVLWEVRSIPAVSFSMLEHNFIKIPWELYLPVGCTVVVKTRALRHSALWHGGAVEQRLPGYLKSYWEGLGKSDSKADSLPNPGLNPSLNLNPGRNPSLNPDPAPAPAPAPALNPNFPQDVFTMHAYMEGAQCRLSLDMCGERLDRRGFEKIVGKAPLRDTMVQGLLCSVAKDYGVVADLMCGSGTFSLETVMPALDRRHIRNYDFQKWPGFRSAAYKQLTFEGKPHLPWIIAADIDTKMVQACANNMERLSPHWPEQLNATNTATISSFFTVQQMDFLNTSPAWVMQILQNTLGCSVANVSKLSKLSKLLVLNPPWGERIQLNQGSTIGKIMEHCATYVGWDVLLVLPKELYTPKHASALRAYEQKQFEFISGGIKVVAVLFSIP
jgi:23S rRNA G2445 N2-methylase RlmL